MDELLLQVVNNAPAVIAILYVMIRVDTRNERYMQAVIDMSERISQMNERILSDCIQHDEAIRNEA